MSARATLLALVAACVFGVALYASVSHLLMTRAPDSPWTAAALLGPLALALASLAWRSGRPSIIAVALAGAALLAAGVALGGVQVEALYVLQHVGVHVVLGAAFASSLLGERSLIARIAARLHPVTPQVLRYARRVTLAWVAYFFGMAVLSLLAWRWTSWAAWSALASFGTPAAVCSLFIGEYLVRYRIHPEFDRVSLRDTLRAWQHRAAPASAAEPAP